MKRSALLNVHPDFSTFLENFFRQHHRLIVGYRQQARSIKLVVPVFTLLTTAVVFYGFAFLAVAYIQNNEALKNFLFNENKPELYNKIAIAVQSLWFIAPVIVLLATLIATLHAFKKSRTLLLEAEKIEMNAFLAYSQHMVASGFHGSLSRSGSEEVGSTASPAKDLNIPIFSDRNN